MLDKKNIKKELEIKRLGKEEREDMWKNRKEEDRRMTNSTGFIESFLCPMH